MLTKSRRSAFLLSASGTLAFTLTSAILNLLLPYWLTGDVHTIIANPDRLRQPADVLVLAAIFAAVLAALVGSGAYWLYRFFGPAYYGSRGALRWALFGALLALLIQATNRFLPAGWWLLRYIVLCLDVFAAFFIARRIVPLRSGPPAA